MVRIQLAPPSRANFKGQIRNHWALIKLLVKMSEQPHSAFSFLCLYRCVSNSKALQSKGFWVHAPSGSATLTSVLLSNPRTKYLTQISLVF